jgi:hypothetical protein
MQDLRWALRSLCRSPGFTIVAALVLALAVGPATAVFSVVNAVLIRPLPYREPAQLLSVSSVVQPPGGAPHDAQSKYPKACVSLRESDLALEVVAF